MIPGRRPVTGPSLTSLAWIRTGSTGSGGGARRAVASSFVLGNGTLEITLVARGLLAPEETGRRVAAPLPSPGLDFPNDPGRPEFPLFRGD